MISSQSKGLLQANVLKITVKKPDNSYHFVHGSQAVNKVVADFPADVPDPHALVAKVPPKAMYVTVLDLCATFSSDPLVLNPRNCSVYIQEKT